jgi:hypothetical protein
MGSLILTSEKENDLKLLKMLAEKLGILAHEISDDDKEDIGLYLAMIEGKKDEFVREEEVLKELRK